MVQQLFVRPQTVSLAHVLSPALKAGDKWRSAEVTFLPGFASRSIWQVLWRTTSVHLHAIGVVGKARQRHSVGGSLGATVGGVPVSAFSGANGLRAYGGTTTHTKTDFAATETRVHVAGRAQVPWKAVPRTAA
jgi:hypothetical protein